MRLASVSFSLVGSRLAQSSTLLIATTQSVIVVGGQESAVRDARSLLRPIARTPRSPLPRLTSPARSTGREKGGRAFPPRSGKAFAAGSRCTNRRASLQKAPSVRLSSARAEGGESRKAAPDKGGLGKPLSLPSANQLIPIPHATPGNERSLLRRRPKPLLS